MNSSKSEKDATCSGRRWFTSASLIPGVFAACLVNAGCSPEPKAKESTAESGEPALNRVWKPDTSSEFEVGTQIRAWTIRDEGMDYILDNMQSMAGVNNLYMVVVMHQEHRPFKAPEFPHNPARDSWEAEDSRVTFFPDLTRYGKIKPVPSDPSSTRIIRSSWAGRMKPSTNANAGSPPTAMPSAGINP